MKNNSPKELSEFSREHLCYEVDSLCAALELFVKRDKKKPGNFADALNAAARVVSINSYTVSRAQIHEMPMTHLRSTTSTR